MGCEDFVCKICKETHSPILMSRFRDVCEYCEAKADTEEDVKYP